MSSWQKAPHPVWHNDPRFRCCQLAGQVLNPSHGAPDQTVNLHGALDGYVAALPDVAIFQDDNTIAGSNAVPSREFNAQFEAGRSYTLTVGVLGGGGGMSNGATFQIGLYYRDHASNRVTVASTTTTNSHHLF